MANPAAPSVPANSNFAFDHYDIKDDGTYLTFLCATPGPNGNSYWTVRVTDAEIATIRTDTQAHTLVDAGALVTTKLQRQIRATGISAALDALIGRSVVV